MIKIKRQDLLVEVKTCMLNLLNSKIEVDGQYIADKLKPLFKEIKRIEAERNDYSEDITIDNGTYNEEDNSFSVKLTSSKYKLHRKAMRDYLEEEIEIDVPKFILPKKDIEPMYLMALSPFIE